jgi:hypothetical protein
MSEDQIERPVIGAQPAAWTAAERMVAQFPTVSRSEIVDVLVEARRSVDLFGLSTDDELAMAEKIAIEQMKQRIGESGSGSSARLDPETHVRRGQKVAEGPTA